MTSTSQEEILQVKESEDMLQVKYIVEQESTLKEFEGKEEKWEELEKPEEVTEKEDMSACEEVENPLEHLEFEHITGSQTPKEVERPLKHLKFEPITGSQPLEEEEKFESLEKSLEEIQEDQTLLSVESVSETEVEDQEWEKIEKFEEEKLSPFEELEKLENQSKEFKLVLEQEIVAEKDGSEQWEKLEKSKDAIMKKAEVNLFTESESLLEKKEPSLELESGIEETFKEPKAMPLNLSEPFVEKQNKEYNIPLELEKHIKQDVMFVAEPEYVVVKTEMKTNIHDEEPEKTQETEDKFIIEPELLKKTEMEDQKPEMEELLKPVVAFEFEHTEEMPGIEVQEVKPVFDKEEIRKQEMPMVSDFKQTVQTIETEPILKATMKEELQQLEKKS
ncbi:uncharacterized protein LOC143252999 [Tachypleus tridentatus]|uniref:uncharacterized protein LOC143252999 n=1 Tax=Tachypleus tridentatus TaxID=6853 RepID=UPI003FD4B98D